METGALLLDFERRLARLRQAGSVDEIDALVMNRSFGTKLPDWISDVKRHLLSIRKP